MDTPVRQRLLEILGKIDRPGTFCTSGLLPSVLPGLEVAGVGPIALPLEKRQAAAIKKRAHQAPYGKGTRTLVDTDVRRVWEIDADQIVLANPQWGDVVKQAVGAAQSELGLENQKLQARLYKLLLYEPGSFFLSHRDGEKLNRMVATLVIALPSAHEGGELVVRHEGREEIVAFSPESQFHTQFAAFYADCEHEIRPVTAGFRLALVYNLTLEKAKRAIRAPTSHEHIDAAARLLRPWSSRKRAAHGSRSASSPSKLAVLLEHQYTQAGLTVDALKGIDRARADVLFAAACESGCDASLALATYWESGAAEPSEDYDYGYRRWSGYGQYDESSDDQGGGEHTMGELFDSSLTAQHFSDAEGNPLAFGRIPLNEEEIVAKQPLGEGKPDKEDFEGYTGNAGMTQERWYHRAAVLLWPTKSRFEVLVEAGVDAAVGGLEQMVRQWKQARGSERELLKQPCLEFASRIIARWPERAYGSGPFVDYGIQRYDDDIDNEVDYDDEDDAHGALDEDDGPRVGRAAREVSPHLLLSLLGELGEVSLISAWIRGVLAKDVSVDAGTILGDLCKSHGWATFRDELSKLFERTSNETLERHARLLVDWSLRKDKNPDRGELCSRLARKIMSALERWDPRGEKRDWRARVVDRSELSLLLTRAFLALDEQDLLDRLVTYILDRPKEFDLTTVQVPALLRLETWLKRNVKHSSSPLHRWLAAIVEELELRKSHPPLEPTDWRRESGTGCKCADCRELSRFLNDPDQETLRLPLAQDRRRHLHGIIDHQKLDTTHVTERRGRPYTLVCTKTKASYERALKAHRVDLDHLAKIQKLLKWNGGLLARAAPIRR
jgi:hypothetical protein